MKKLLILSLIIFLTAVPETRAYDAIGHRTIASVAQKKLNGKTRKKLEKLLGKNGVIYTSTWADEVRNQEEFRKYAPWHYQNLRKDLSDAELLDLMDHPLKDGEHLFNAIHVLKSRLKHQPNDTTALKFLIHFVGDLHQPMHLGRLEDLGGNQIKINWFGEQINLHSLWDTYLIETRKMSWSEYSEYLCDKYEFQPLNFKHDEKSDILRGYAICKEIYDYDYTIRNNYVYIDKFREKLELMLYLGGLELADILNEIYSTH